MSSLMRMASETLTQLPFYNTRWAPPLVSTQQYIMYIISINLIGSLVRAEVATVTGTHSTFNITSKLILPCKFIHNRYIFATFAYYECLYIHIMIMHFCEDVRCHLKESLRCIHVGFKIQQYLIWYICTYLSPSDGIPYDGIPIEEVVTVSVVATVIYIILATAGIIFAAICILFTLIFRKKKQVFNWFKSLSHVPPIPAG